MHFLTSLLLVFLTSLSWAANITISASVDKSVASIGEPIQLQIVVSGDVRNIPLPQIPELNDFNIQSSGRSQNISIVNGRISSSVSFNYLLLPKKIGKFNIGPFTITYDGKTISSSVIEIEVKAEKSQKTPAIDEERKDAPAIFIETLVDKRNVYVGQQIILTFRFYTSVNLLSQPQYSAPSLTGFVSEDLPPQRNYRTTIGGREYQVTELKTALFPVTKGNLTIGPATLVCTIMDIGDDPYDTFFRSFFSSGKRVELKSKPIVISVQDLPAAGQPADFSGAVGNYQIHSSIDKTRLETGQAATLKVKISGTGNIKSIPQPKIITPNFRQYETLSSVNISKEGQRIGGHKEFKTVIIPTKAGKQTIPPVAFSFFEPDSGTYKTVFTAPIILEVLPGKVANIPAVSDEKSQQPLRYVAEDIRHIKQTMSRTISPKITNMWLLLQLLPVCFFVVLLQQNRARQKLFSDKKLFNKIYAYKVAMKSLKKISHMAGQKTHNVNGISENLKLSEILKNYIADKCGISKYGVTNEQIIDTLKSFNIDESLLSEIEKFLTESDYLRYAPAQKNTADFQADIKKVRGLIEKIQMNLK